MKCACLDPQGDTVNHWAPGIPWVSGIPAIDWQKKALATNPRNPTYRQFLANHLGALITAARGDGRDDEAAAAQRELTELHASDPRFAATDARLAAVMRGQAPKDNAERLALAQRAHDTARYATAARLWAEALEADPKLVESRQTQHCYNAACAAALAGSGNATDDPAPDADAKAKLRQQALNWLKSELAAWSKLLRSGPAQANGAIAQTLKHWQEDTDLAGVRDAEALRKLAEEERKGWDALWAEVKDLLEITQGPDPRMKNEVSVRPMRAMAHIKAVPAVRIPSSSFLRYSRRSLLACPVFAGGQRGCPKTAERFGPTTPKSIDPRWLLRHQAP